MKTKADSLRSLLDARPRSIKLDRASPVRFDVVRQKDSSVALFHAAEQGPDLLDWVSRETSLVEEKFAQYGAVLFRGFGLRDDGAFRQFTQKLAKQLTDYAEPSTPRTKVSEKVYTSTEYPKEEAIPLHNERSYANNWPLKIWFYCVTPAASGGETPLADSRKVFERIAPEVRRQFEQKGVMYVRNFHERLDLAWQEVFQTDSREEVEARCREAAIDCAWGEDGRLRTTQVCQAVATHPRTGERVWFNQAHLFHVSNLDPAVREYLLEKYGEDELPRNAFFGDGTAIGDDALEEIRHAYRQSEINLGWQAGDILMLDNMLYAHGRRPFEGERRVLVTMAEPVTAAACAVPAAAPAAVQARTTVTAVRQQTAAHFLKGRSREESHESLKYKLAAAYRIMVAEGLDEGGISGHITARVPGQPESFWVNPFGLLAEEVTPHNLIKVDQSGEVLEGDYPVNVAGFCIHAALHKARPDVNCIVHTHSPWGTLFSALGRHIEPIDQNCCMFFENHALYDDYHGPVIDDDEALRLARALADKSVLVLSNHGTITCGQSVEEATMLMVAAERAFRLNVNSSQTGPLRLIAPEVARQTRQWIANPLGLAIEFDALVRKVERLYPDFREFRTNHPTGH